MGHLYKTCIRDMCNVKKKSLKMVYWKEAHVVKT